MCAESFQQPKYGYHDGIIVFKRSHLFQSTGGVDIAILNTRASSALCKIDAIPSTRYTVFVSAIEWSQKFQDFKKIGKAAFLDVNIYIYGPNSRSLDTGKILSRAGLYLQRPIIPQRVEYNNPQYLRLPFLQDGQRSSGFLPSVSSSSTTPTPDPISSILNSLDQQNELELMQVDESIIATTLQR
jgi:hypothetical protein